MKYVDEYRDPETSQKLIDAIRDAATKRWVLMDVCGGQTHSLLRNGIETALDGYIELVHGPGCPVCVTATQSLDFAQQLCQRPGVILASFGDMLRVPGSRGTLLDCRARGGRVQVVYSPLDAVELAQQSPNDQIVFFGVGFETTAPATALAILQAESLGLKNFSVLAAHVRVLPAMEALMQMPETRVQGFLAAGHVCSVTGFDQYAEFAARHQTPIAIAGFEPLDLLEAIKTVVDLLENGQSAVVNCYARCVQGHGNQRALETLQRVYENCHRVWRGFGVIQEGGYRIKAEYQHLDAEHRFSGNRELSSLNAELCLGAEVMSGQIKPPQCPFFGRQCTTAHPLGAPMVSSEGACAAYIRFQEQMVSQDVV